MFCSTNPKKIERNVEHTRNSMFRSTKSEKVEQIVEQFSRAQDLFLYELIKSLFKDFRVVFKQVVSFCVDRYDQRAEFLYFHDP